MLTDFVTAAIAAVAGFFWQSELEWRVHRTVHQPKVIPRFNGHLQHHKHFAGTSHRREEGDDTSVLILSSVWHAIGFDAASLMPFILCGGAFFAFGRDSWAAAIVIAGVFDTVLYHLLIEGIHWLAHAPERRGSLGAVVRWLSLRHARHHDNWRTNFNTVFPFGDWVHGTLS